MPSPRGLGAARPFSLRQLQLRAGLTYAAAEKLVADGLLPAGAQSEVDVVVGCALARLPRRSPDRALDALLADLLRDREISDDSVVLLQDGRADLLDSPALALPAVAQMGAAAVTVLPVGAWLAQAREDAASGRKLDGEVRMAG